MAFLSLSNGAVILGFGVVFWLVRLIIWRRYAHPLANFPGPFVNAVSNIPVVIKLLGGKPHIYIRRLHEKYGPVVRTAPNELSFCGAGAWDDIYGFRVSCFQCTYDQPMEKDPLWVGALNAELDVQPLSYAPREAHRRQRRAFAHPFSNTSCLQQESLIQHQIDKFIRKLAHFAQTNQPVNMTDWLSFLALDIIGDLCFAAPFGCLDDGVDTSWAENVNNAKRYGTYELCTRRIAGTRTWLQKMLVRWLIPNKYKEGRIKHFVHSKDKVTARLQDTDKDHKDFIYYILRNNESKQLLSANEILLNSSLFIAAGSDTTGSSLSSAVYILCTHPKVYSTLATEIRNACPTQASITYANVNPKALPYLSAFLSETMRFFTPIATGLLRTVPSPETSDTPKHQKSNGSIDNDPSIKPTASSRYHETYIDGYGPIPPGTTVSAHHYTSTRSPLNWTRPHEFLPERWLHPERFPADKPHASQPFMLGPRGCIGKNLSHIEQRLVLCSLLLHFDVELDGGREEVGAPGWGQDPDTGDWRDIKTFIAFEQPELRVRLTKREVELE